MKAQHYIDNELRNLKKKFPNKTNRELLKKIENPKLENNYYKATVYSKGVWQNAMKDIERTLWKMDKLH